MHDPDTTVVAVATPPGRGGLGCLRISGSRAAEIAARLFEPRRRRAGSEQVGAPLEAAWVERSGGAASTTLDRGPGQGSGQGKTIEFGVFLDRDQGEPIASVQVFSASGEVLRPRDVMIKAGPGATPEAIERIEELNQNE